MTTRSRREAQDEGASKDSQQADNVHKSERPRFGCVMHTRKAHKRHEQTTRKTTAQEINEDMYTTKLCYSPKFAIDGDDSTVKRNKRYFANKLHETLHHQKSIKMVRPTKFVTHQSYYKRINQINTTSKASTMVVAKQSNR